MLRAIHTPALRALALLFGLSLLALPVLSGCKSPDSPQSADEPENKYSVIAEASKRSYGDPILPELKDEVARRAAIKFPDELYQRSTSCFKIDMHTPYLGIDSIDGQIRIWEEALREEAIKEFTAGCEAGARNNTLDLSYETSSTFGNTVSVLFLPSMYTGGAHPMTNPVAMNFDTRSGRQLEYEDIFNNTEGLYEHLAGYARLALKPVLGEYWDNGMDFEQGLEPKPENFKNFVLTPEGLVLVFPQYQIAPYSAGIQSCLVPLVNLVRFQPKPGVWQ